MRGKRSWLLQRLSAALTPTAVGTRAQVVGNSGFIVPDKAFLQGLRDIATQYGAVLCFDEVMTVRTSATSRSISLSVPARRATCAACGE